MNEVTEDDLMAALLEEVKSIEIIQPRDVTPKRLAKQSGRALAMVEKLLKTKVEKGELRTVKKYDPEVRRNVTVYVEV